MTERIKILMDQKSLTATQFSEVIKVQRSSLSHVLSGRNKPSLDFMLKIKNGFPEINLDWLLLGQGEMELLATKNIAEESSRPDQEISQAEIKFFEDQKTREEITDSKLKDTGSSLKEIITGGKANKDPVRVILFYGDNSFESFEVRPK